MKSNYIDKQWAQPKRYLFHGYGITFWKWCGIYVPLTLIHLGKSYIGTDIFHNGSGFELNLRNFLIIRICTKGKLGWWYKHGKFEIIFLNKYKFEY